MARYSLDLSPELDAALKDLADRSGSTKAEVLRKGIGLVKVAVDAKKEGKVFGVADSVEKLIREIINV
jgi:predicted DNA-binding protein